MKKCPFCAEEIQDEAIKCRFCQESLKTDERAAQQVLEFTVPKIQTMLHQAPEARAAAEKKAVICTAVGSVLIVTATVAQSAVAALVGVIAFLAAVALMVKRSVPSIDLLAGPCPYCGKGVTSMKYAQGFNCASCAGRVVLKDEKFYRVSK